METTIEAEVEVDPELLERFGGSMPLAELEDQICSRSANLTAAEGEWLLLVAEFDRRMGWAPSGHRSCADWLAWETSIDLRTAYEKVRVANVLVEYPPLATAMSTGLLSYAKARAITRIVRPDNVDELLTLARTHTANQVENIVACYRRHEVSADEATERAFRERAMTWRLAGATAVITMRMPVDQASELYGMMGEFMDFTDLHIPEIARRVDALMTVVEFATATLRMGLDPVTTDPRYLASVHLTPDIFDTADHDTAAAAPDDPVCGPLDGPEFGHLHEPGCAGSQRGVCCVQPSGNTQIPPAGIARSSARRMLCDAAIQGFRTSQSGEAEVGTASRTVPRKLKRALMLRDGGCRFPGCTMVAWVDAHHIKHWLDHGPTRPNNLACLCRRHHRLMHEGGWNITGDPAGELFFHQPDGTVIAAQPPVRSGAADFVNRLGLSATQGRCGWVTKHCNYSQIVEVLHDTERARRRSRTCATAREPEPAFRESP